MCRAPSPTTLPKKPPRSLIPLALRISRPYYYLVTLWLYLLPTGGRYELFSTYPFWLGLAYCTLPLNLLTYLMNDYADVAVDADNPRKGGALLGAKEDAARLRAVVPIAAAVQLPFLLAFAAICGAVTWPWFLAVVFVNWLYNFGPRLSSGHYPPLDLFCPCGYLLVILLSCWLNNLPYPPQKSFMHAAILVVRTQLWIQTFDADADAAAGRRTTAVRLGVRGAQVALLCLLLSEVAYVQAHFDNWPLQSFSAASVAMLGAQALLTSRSGAGKGEQELFERPPPAMSAASINAVFLVLGAGGLGLMVRVWLDAAFA